MKENMYSIKIDGFKTKEQAEAFVQWYEGQGEQDASIWFECKKNENEIDVDFMPVDCKKTYPLTWTGDVLSATLDIK